MNLSSKLLVFNPTYKDYIWGGSRIASLYARGGTPERCAESWEIAAHPDGDSVVAQGPFAGRTLSGLVAKFGAALIGTRAPSPTRFPLLFKLIDAREKLSVQVHPSNATAGLTGGEPKTEMWYVLGHTDGASLYAGLREGVTPDTLRAALDNGTAEQCLVEMRVAKGESLFIPGGLVHAIGAGCLIYEVQQNSNTTYRFYDWGRVGADGKPRPLHVAESFKVMDWALPPPRMTPPTVTHTTARAAWADVVSCDYFNVRKLTVRGQETVPLDGTSFHALFVEAGRAFVEVGDNPYLIGAGAMGIIPSRAPPAYVYDHLLTAGASALIPAAATRYTVTGHASILVTTL